MSPPPEDAALDWRVGALERGHDKLDDEKADAKDVARLAEEFKSLRLTLQWFMGVVAVGAVSFIVLAIQLATN